MLQQTQQRIQLFSYRFCLLRKVFIASCACVFWFEFFPQSNMNSIVNITVHTWSTCFESQTCTDDCNCKYVIIWISTITPAESMVYLSVDCSFNFSLNQKRRIIFLPKYISMCCKVTLPHVLRIHSISSFESIFKYFK